jgi:hypothetical protein
MVDFVKRCDRLTSPSASSPLKLIVQSSRPSNRCSTALARTHTRALSLSRSNSLKAPCALCCMHLVRTRYTHRSHTDGGITGHSWGGKRCAAEAQPCPATLKDTNPLVNDQCCRPRPAGRRGWGGTVRARLSDGCLVIFVRRVPCSICSSSIIITMPCLLSTALLGACGGSVCAACALPLTSEWRRVVSQLLLPLCSHAARRLLPQPSQPGWGTARVLASPPPFLPPHGSSSGASMPGLTPRPS